MEKLVDSLPLEVVPVTAATARRVAEAYARWGKGVHPAGLNLGDCFAYEAADTHACPLLFIGNDFVRTDIRRGSDAWAHDRRTPCFCTAAPQVLTIGNSLFSDS